MTGYRFRRKEKRRAERKKRLLYEREMKKDRNEKPVESWWSKHWELIMVALWAGAIVALMILCTGAIRDNTVGWIDSSVASLV
jgi:hypothetical protein